MKWIIPAAIVVVVAIIVSVLLLPKRGPKDGVVLIIRHAEKPDSGGGLSKKGMQRADAYAPYFADYKIGTVPLHLSAIYSTADSNESQRPRVTVQPLANSIRLRNDSQFGRNQIPELAAALRSNYQGKHVLVSWHHGGIPDLVSALGADPKEFLPDGEWPDGVFNWVIQLRFDHEGRVVQTDSRRVTAHMLPGDSH